MRVLVLTPYPHGTVAGPRSSFELWEPVLADAEIELTYTVFETDRLHEILYLKGRAHEKAFEMARSYAGMLADIAGAQEYDAVLVNREATLIGPAVIERWIARQGVPLIYLLDDPLYIPYRSSANGLWSHLKCFGKVKTLCRISRTVIANSPSNRLFAANYNDNVWEIPSVVDGELYTGWEAHSGSPGNVCVGWSGSSSTVANLQAIRGPLRALSERDDVRLVFIGGGDVGMPELPHESVPWRAETEVEDLRRLDVGLLPLALTPWTPHKFYLKLVQYMALGIPPVATPLGSNALVIEDGRTGFLARDGREWIAAVERLVKDPGLRESIGRRGAEEARQRYTVQANAERIVAAFRSALTAV
jgi:glycosyltransferase involved in cell wall biosynthesis